MCEVNPQDKLRAVPIMLKADALNYYANTCSRCKDFEEVMDLLKEWYNINDRKARILNNWQSMSLTEAMEAEPNESEVTVFQKFTTTLLSLQQQLDKSYHSDTLLRDRLLTAVDMPAVKAGLRDRFPRTSKQAINRVAIQLSERKKSAGSASAYWTARVRHCDARYSLDRIYGGDAKRPMRRPYKTGGGRRRTSEDNTKRGNGGGNGRRLNLEWMRGVKWCFVCGKDHRASTRHSHREVIEAIN